MQVQHILRAHLRGCPSQLMRLPRSPTVTASSVRLKTQWRRETERSLTHNKLEESRPTGTSPAGSTNVESFRGPQKATNLGFTATSSTRLAQYHGENVVHLSMLSSQIAGLSIRIASTYALFQWIRVGFLEPRSQLLVGAMFVSRPCR